MSVLAFSDLHKSYGDFPALRGVSFDVQEGEVLGLLGPNGAGKTTLIRCLMDIVRPDSGAITLFDRPHHRDLLDRVGYLPEERGLYTKHRVIDVLTYFGSLKGFSRAEARTRGTRWLERVGLAETATWKISRLSKGLSQKVQIAATLMAEPELCVLDEPFSGLDPVNVRLVQELINERKARRLATILSTHQMNLVEAMCDRIALINKGRLMVYGTVREVRSRYSRAEVIVEAAAAPLHIAGVDEIQPADGGGWRLRLSPGAAPRDVLAGLVAAGARLDRFEPTLAPLEDVFIHVVQQGES